MHLLNQLTHVCKANMFQLTTANTQNTEFNLSKMCLVSHNGCKSRKHAHESTMQQHFGLFKF